ncbi:MAG: T9SS type A sorting domain-containing protein [Candidatus Marinimicrobia bacterium]|nr:T9SS type A sorting domain-containing protein [Candidatus Neomarinimicrobiota bacterium]
MKKIILLLLIPIIAVNAQTAIAPSAGDGTESNPYQIASLGNLYWISADSSNWDKHYVQIADINASILSWEPIGTSEKPFSGSYDGQYYIIDSLSMYSAEDYSLYQGLFGYIRKAKLFRIGLLNTKILIRRAENIGPLAGLCDSSSIYRCFSTGQIRGNHNVGGLVGYLIDSEINECYTDVEVTAVGLYADWLDQPFKGYAGGIAGFSENSIIKNCYSIKEVLSIASRAISQRRNDNVTIDTCYSLHVGKTEVYSTLEFHGIPGNSFCMEPILEGRYTEISSFRTSEQLKDELTYLNAGWDFVIETENGTDDIWDIDNNGVINDGYPFLAWEHPDTTYFTAIDESDIILSQNYPNPFNPTTTLSYELPEQADVQMIIYDIAGRLIKQWSYQNQATGTYKITWNSTDQTGNSAPSGVYIYRMVAGGFVESRKMVLLK